MFHLTNNFEVYADANRNEVLFVHRGVGNLYHYSCDENGKKFLSYLDSNQPISIYDDHFKTIVEELHRKGILTQKNSEKSIRPELRSQLQSFEDLKIDPKFAQEKIENSKVLIIGVGGTGGWLALELASLGVKDFVIIDPDHVESSNISRQVFRHKDIGKLKTTALKEIMKEKNPSVQVKSYEEMVVEGSTFKKWFHDRDYIFIAADAPSAAEAARIIGKECCVLGKTHFICGGYSGHNSTLGITVIPGVTPCWDCFVESTKHLHHPLIKNENLIYTAPKSTSGIIYSVLIAASATASEFVRVAIGLKPVFNGKRYDLTHDWNLPVIEYSFSDQCPTCTEVNHVRIA